MSAAESLVTRTFKLFAPPPKLTLTEWADKYAYLSAESAAEPGKWTTLPYQRGIQDAITDPLIERVTVMKSARVGYALALDTPLPTPSGWTTMGEVQEGDILFDENGKTCRVVTKSPVYTDHKCYRIRFCDGSEIVADAGHRWAVEADFSLEYLCGTRGTGRIGRPKPGETVTTMGVIDTETMSQVLKTVRGRTVLAVRNSRPLNTPEVNLPIPPYTLGQWLGDGHLVTPRITLHRSDTEVADYIQAEGINAVVRYIDDRYPNNATIFLDIPHAGRPISKWSPVFRALGLLKKKHIPKAYLRASWEQRLAILRGLMDSDGTIGKNGRAEFTNTNEALARGVYELVVSLGLKASFRKRPPQREGVLAQYRVNFKATPLVNPFLLQRKAARVLESAKPSITMRRRVVSVEPAETVPVQCIQVDSPNSLYLAGHQMIPTHNTKIIGNAIGYFIHYDPCPIMVVQPTEGDAEQYSKEEIAPMIRDTPVLKERVSDAKSRDSSNTILQKLFNGGSLSLVGANSPRGFRRVSRRVVIFDEVDGYPPSAGAEGDQIKLGIRRSEYYWNRKIIAGSTPTTEALSRITRMFEESDQRYYYVPCPHCQGKQVLKFPNMKWPEGDPLSAYFVCEHCLKPIDHKHKVWMIQNGEWVAEKPFAGHAGFHIWAAYSYSPNSTWGHIAKEFLEAQKNGTEALKTFINTVLGETWKEKGDAPEWQRLYERREPYPIGVVPSPVVFLTAGADVQKDRIEVEIVGWGRDKQSWSVDYRVIHGDTAVEETWQELDNLLGATWSKESGTALGIRMLAVDSGFNTQHVYNWARRYPMNRVMAVKGVDSASVMVGTPSPVDVTVRGKKIKRGFKVWPIGVGIAKGELYAWLKLDRPTEGNLHPAGYCHYPEYGEEYFKQLTAEQLVVRMVKGYRRYDWEKTRDRNEALDVRVYARAAAAAVGLDRFSRAQWDTLASEAGAPPDSVSSPRPVSEPARSDQPKLSGKPVALRRRPSSFL